MSKPGSFSPLRQLAYRTSAPLPGPSSDPDGWFACPPVTVRATAFRSQRVKLACNLHLAAPLAYTRGSVLPLSLTIGPTHPVPDAATVQALDIIATPGSLHAVLRRRVRYTTASKKGKVHEDVDDVAQAVWWKHRPASRTDEVRRLEGEIRLPKDLVPSSCVGDFSVTYEVVLCAFRAPLVALDGDDGPLIAKSVDVVSGYGRGPRPVPYAPPGYSSGRETRERSAPYCDAAPMQSLGW
jgi:hypothetical protein